MLFENSRRSVHDVQTYYRPSKCLFLLLCVLLLPGVIVSQPQGIGGAIGLEELERRLYAPVIHNLVVYESARRTAEMADMWKDGVDNVEYFFEQSVPLLETGRRFVFRLRESGMKMPDSTIQVYEFSLPAFVYLDVRDLLERGECIEYTRFAHRFNRYAETGLIGITRDTALLFLSGELFLDNIAKYYFREGMSSTAMIEYIQMRYYNRKPVDVVVDRAERAVRFRSAIDGAQFEVRFVPVSGPGIWREEITTVG